MGAKEQCETLMNDLLPFAEKMLREYGEFHPFGGTMGTDDTITHVGASTGEEFPSGQELVRVLKQGFVERRAAGEIKAAAIIANVSVTPPDQDNPVDAIAVRLHHIDGYTVNVFFPYTLSRKKLSVGEPYTLPGTPFLGG
jgi:hypothetical protein